MLVGHAPPLIGIEVLEVEPLAVRTVRDDDRILAGVDRAEDVGPEHEAIGESDRHVPVDLHHAPSFNTGRAR